MNGQHGEDDERVAMNRHARAQAAQARAAGNEGERRLPAWTRDYAIGLALVLLCAVAILLVAGQASRHWRRALGGPAPDEARVARDAMDAFPERGAPTNPPASTPAASGALARPPAPTAGAARSSSSPANATPGADAAATNAPTAADVASVVRELQARRLTIPVAGVTRETLASGSFLEGRESHTHEALDILAPRGTAIVAVEDGRIAKLFWSQAGGHTIYQFDPSDRVAYYYAHLDRYADGLTEGHIVHRGDIIGFVGSTGNAHADAPHLHFAIFVLTPERQWWKGTAIDPYPVLR